MSDCVFCDIVAGKSPAKFLQPDNWPYVVVFEPINPVTPGHVLVVNRRHSADFVDNEYIFGDTARMAAKYARYSNMGPVNFITSRGREATQSVFHLHVHLVPRRKDDGLHLPWTEQISQRNKVKAAKIAYQASLKTGVPVSDEVRRLANG